MQNLQQPLVCKEGYTCNEKCSGGSTIDNRKELTDFKKIRCANYLKILFKDNVVLLKILKYNENMPDRL